MNLDFENPSNYFAFKLLVLLILFGVSSSLLVVNYLNLPELTLDERNHIYRNHNDINIVKDNTDYFVLNLFDNKISGIENIIIWVFTLWGFMKLIDLMFFLEKYKKD